MTVQLPFSSIFGNFVRKYGSSPDPPKIYEKLMQLEKYSLNVNTQSDSASDGCVSVGGANWFL